MRNKNTKRSGHKYFLPWVTKATGFQFYETVHASIKHNYRQAKISVPAFHTQVLHSILFFRLSVCYSKLDYNDITYLKKYSANKV